MPSTKIGSTKSVVDATGRAARDLSFVGYHPFMSDPACPDPQDYGSFEVFHSEGYVETGTVHSEPGFYWWPCFPGCLPDGEPNGPFATAEGAYLDAIGD